MSDIAPMTTAIAIGVALLACAGAWAWVLVTDFLRRRREWKERRGQWKQFLK